MSSEQKSSAAKWLFIVIAVLVLIGVLTFLGFNFTYSEGNRAGILIKFSEKGYVFKTCEGELNVAGLGNISNTVQMNQPWTFSVTNKAIAIL